MLLKRADVTELSHRRRERALPRISVMKSCESQTSERSAARSSDFRCIPGAIADLQAIAARIFKEKRVISCLILHGTFYAPSASTCYYLRESVNVRGTLSPEGDAILIRNMCGRLGNPKKLSDAVIRTFKLKPPLHSHSIGKPQGRQQRPVESGHICKLRYSQVDVVKVSRHTWTTSRLIHLLLVESR